MIFIMIREIYKINYLRSANVTTFYNNDIHKMICACKMQHNTLSKHILKFLQIHFLFFLLNINDFHIVYIIVYQNYCYLKQRQR